MSDWWKGLIAGWLCLGAGVTFALGSNVAAGAIVLLLVVAAYRGWL